MYQWNKLIKSIPLCCATIMLSSVSQAVEFAVLNYQETFSSSYSALNMDEATVAAGHREYSNASGSAYQVIISPLWTPDIVNKTQLTACPPSRRLTCLDPDESISPDDADYQFVDEDEDTENDILPCDGRRVLKEWPDETIHPVIGVPWEYFLESADTEEEDWAPQTPGVPRSSVAFTTIEAALRDSPDGCVRYWYDRLWLTADNMRSARGEGQKVLLKNEFIRRLDVLVPEVLESESDVYVYPGMPAYNSTIEEYYEGTGWDFYDDLEERASYANSETTLGVVTRPAIPNANLNAFFAALFEVDIAELAVEASVNSFPVGTDEMDNILISYGEAAARIHDRRR